MKEQYSNFRGARKIEILEIHVNEGEGVPDDATYREVYYTHLDGTFIGKKTNFPLRKFADDKPE